MFSLSQFIYFPLLSFWLPGIMSLSLTELKVALGLTDQERLHTERQMILISEYRPTGVEKAQTEPQTDMTGSGSKISVI